MQKASLRWLGAIRPSCGFLEPDRRERLVLGDVHSTAPRKFKRSEKARGEAGSAKLRILAARQKCLEESPIERHSNHFPDALDSFVKSHDGARVNDVECWRRTSPHSTIGPK